MCIRYEFNTECCIIAIDIGENKEVGRLDIMLDKVLGYCKIERFQVRPTYRNRKIGSNMLHKVVVNVKNTACKVNEIEVYPNPEPYSIYDSNEKDEPMKNEELYQIYEKLNFQYVDKNVNKNKSNNRMILYI